ncbi:SDR family NAD(P)-dependent oxidoreductase [Maribellus sp. CM-23]|uniref:SDR family NAD(P)-dependent oxidoreductase n=1 Tax=Maribellus sp. CM-23 TaxID=2781026 RepID=UPI001F3F0CD3|nr:SDR family NAD(P)-dependent oxidoreductase [Maribellus sp. CM-23]MCE4564597.1 SDR family NAD(P)-dependent oxidoreductase [Maribellus sp. CM-23]
MKHAIITGSSRGIGLALTKVLIHRKDFKIIGSSTSGKHPIKANNFECYRLNLNDEKSIKKFVGNVQHLKIDYLFNNAGILVDSNGDPKIDLKKLEQTFSVNLFGTMQLTELLIPHLTKNAHIINISSGWGSFSEKNFDAFNPHYKMSKAALNMYTKLLSERLKSAGITVSAFDPGWVKTDMGGANADRTSEEVADELMDLMSKSETGKFWHQGSSREW